MKVIQEKQTSGNIATSTLSLTTLPPRAPNRNFNKTEPKSTVSPNSTVYSSSSTSSTTNGPTSIFDLNRHIFDSGPENDILFRHTQILA